MDDVITESGLSAGALYRYYASKDELIRATIEDTIDQIQAVAARVIAADPLPTPGRTVETVLETIFGMLAPNDPDMTRIALYAWAEAPHNPAVKEALGSRYLAIRDLLADVATRYTDDDTHADEMGKALLASIIGFVVQRTILGDIVPKDLGIGLDALTRRTPGRSAGSASMSDPRRTMEQ